MVALSGRAVGRELLERDAELGEIDGALAGAAAGEGWLVLLKGPAGIGKTALLTAAGERATAAGLTVLAARGGELERGFPYGVVRDLLEPAVRGASPARRERLLAGAAALAKPAVLWEGGSTADPLAQMFAVVHGLYWLLANLAGEAPLALLIDDVHWADQPSLRFLAYLARRLDGLAATVIASVRTGDAGSDEHLLDEIENSPGARLAVPAALSREGVTAMLAADFGRPPDPEFATSCREVTGGNPFFVHELAAALKADEIEPTAESTEQVSTAAPQTVGRATLARLGRASEDAAELARAVAVLGEDALLPRAASLAGLNERRAMAALDALHAAEVVSASGRLEFRHPIVHAAVLTPSPPISS